MATIKCLFKLLLSHTGTSITPDLAIVFTLLCRKDCADPIGKSCKEKYGTFIERDTIVWRWRETVVRNIYALFTKLGFKL